MLDAQFVAVETPAEKASSVVDEVLAAIPPRYWLAFGVIALGLVLGYVVKIVNHRLLESVGVNEVIEGTAFERMARELGTSTVSIVANLSQYFIVVIAVLAALSVAEITYADPFWNEVAGFFPQLFFAALVVIVGVVFGDKVELALSERLRGVKLPQIGILPSLAKYVVIYVALLVALSQIGIVTLPLVVLEAAILFGAIVLGGLAFKDMLVSGAAGVYLFLNQPYSIGDEIRVGETRGIVQEIGLFVTRVEEENEEFIIPNRRVFEDGVARSM